MIKLPATLDLQAVARRTVWFKSPIDALANPVHFIAHVLTYGLDEDVTTLRKYINDDEVADAIIHAPPGIFDPRSRAYWNLKIGRYPAPPLPKRHLPLQRDFRSLRQHRAQRLRRRSSFSIERTSKQQKIFPDLSPCNYPIRHLTSVQTNTEQGW